MPVRSENGERQSDNVAQTASQSTILSQAWWQSVGNGPSFGESSLKSSTAEHTNGSQTNGAVQSQGGSSALVPSLKQVLSSTTAAVGGRLEPNSDMELVGHSMVLTPYHYSDPQHGGLLTSYGPQTLVTPQFYGMNHARMHLPLEMEEEPVYVNAKQFHGIMRRRQARAKAELEKKVVKTRKPYLHESRHQHAMRRARGCGGRFISAKKQDSGAGHAFEDKTVNSRDHQEQNRCTAPDVEVHLAPICNSSALGLSLTYHLSSSDCIRGGFLGQQRDRTHGNGASDGTQPIN